MHLWYNAIMQIYHDKIFYNPIDTIEIFAPKDLKSGFDRIEKYKNNGLYIIGYLRYDLSHTVKGYPLMYFEVYDKFKQFVADEIEKCIGISVSPKITKEEYFEKINYIKNKIKEGITYEVNFTYPSIVKTNADDFELYNFLLKKQKTPYNTFLKNKYETILSFSPELFFKLKGNKILTKPMKGTAPKGKNTEENNKIKEFLYNDIKNRAENVMIVDLLRNDLGKIAKTGSVKVEKLFDIEEHKTLFQMTSEISAELEYGTTLFDIFNAIYPCGSITGAPKKSTMQVISETEKFSREVYCGAIGLIHKDYTEISVPIRILQKKQNEKFYTYYAGGAIVWDSTAEDEWEETLTKTKFLQTDFTLIETGIGDWDLHLKRLKNSAQELGFTWNNTIENIEFTKNVVSRIELFKNGNFTLTTRNIPDTVHNPKIKIEGTVNSSNPFLYHKTSLREHLPTDIFEKIKINEKGEITEGIFTNIAIKQGGNIYTPPISCGLLNGIMRQKLLDTGKIKEKIIYSEDLKSAEKIYCFNSVRGIIEVELC